MCYFSVGGPNSRQRYGGPKSLLLGKFTMLSLLFLPPRGPNSIANFDGGIAGLAPLDPPLVSVNYNMKINTKKTKLLRVSKRSESDNEDSSCRGNYRTSQGILLLWKHDLR